MAIGCFGSSLRAVFSAASVSGPLSSSQSRALASSRTRTEAEIALCRLGFDPGESVDPWQRLREDWERCHVVPVDPDCLARAAEVGCRHQLRTLDALHLAAADRLPRPLVVLTFDRRQADAARSLDLTVEGA